MTSLPLYFSTQVTKEGRAPLPSTFAEPDKKIVVDRPFIFVIQDRINKIPVLVGKVTDPTKTES